MDIPVLETERLILRAWRQSDFEPYAEFFASEASRMVGGPVHRNEAWRKMATMAGHWMLRGFGMWAVEEKSTGDFCGQCGLWFPDGWPEPEVGWALVLRKQGRGYATEAARRARAYAFETLGWTRLVSCIEAANTPSIRVAERLGAVHDYTQSIPGRTFDVYVHPGSAPRG